MSLGRLIGLPDATMPSPTAFVFIRHFHSVEVAPALRRTCGMALPGNASRGSVTLDIKIRKGGSWMVI